MHSILAQKIDTKKTSFLNIFDCGQIVKMYELEHMTTPAGIAMINGNFGVNGMGRGKIKKKKLKITPDDLFDFATLDVEGHVRALKWAKKQRITRTKVFNIIKLSIKNSLHKPVCVSSYSDCVTYAQVLQLHIIDCHHEEYGDSDNMPEGRVLSANIPNIKVSKYVREGCNLRAGTFLEPCVRNTFQFMDPRGITMIGRPVLFNTDILIKLYDTEGFRPLFVEGFRDTKKDSGDISNRYSLRFTNTPNPSCYFKIRHPIQQRRAQYDGAIVSSDVRLVFQHSNTGLYLATEFGELEENIFGMEPIVDLRTCVNRDGVHTKENMFVVFVG